MPKTKGTLLTVELFAEVFLPQIEQFINARAEQTEEKVMDGVKESERKILTSNEN